MKKLLFGVAALIGFAAIVSAQEFRTTVFEEGLEGTHTFRIPAIIQSNDGTLLAFAEARRNTVYDSGNIDVVVRRSEDGGRTWGEIITIWDDGVETCGNPCPVVDKETGRIILVMNWNKASDGEGKVWKGTSEDTRRCFVSFSDDDGRTWTEAREITSQVKKKGWTTHAVAPGHGMQVALGKHKGRIVIPANHASLGNPFESFVIYSDNGGKKWKIGGTPGLGNECTMAELSDGTLMLNMRNQFMIDMSQYERRGTGRWVALSEDGGKTFGQAWMDEQLTEPICQGSLVNYCPDGTPSSTLFFSNPNDPKNRVRMTIKRSDDDGKTWRTAYSLGEAPASYSDLVVCSDGSLGLLYETGEKHPFERIDFVLFTPQP